MGMRRKELEDKAKKEEIQKIEDQQRIINQNKLKERVVNSKHLIDNNKALEEKRKQKQEDFKKGLKENKKEYLEELERRKQKVYNKPLMFEQKSSTVSKLKAARIAKNAINDDIQNDEAEVEEIM